MFCLKIQSVNLSICEKNELLSNQNGFIVFAAWGEVVIGLYTSSAADGLITNE